MNIVHRIILVKKNEVESELRNAKKQVEAKILQVEEWKKEIVRIESDLEVINRYLPPEENK